mgnify:CR=1 FL=1
MSILDDFKSSQDVNVLSDYIDKTSGGPLLSKPIKYAGYKIYIQDSNTDQVELEEGEFDSFRRDILNFWSKTPSPYDDSAKFKLRSVPSVIYDGTTEPVLKVYSDSLNSFLYLKKISSKSEGATRGGLGTIRKDRYKIFMKPEDVSQITDPNPNWWSQYLETYIQQNIDPAPQTIYNLSDFNFMMDAPSYSREAANMSKGQSYVHVKSNYNFLSFNYEDVIDDPEIEEAMLPNLYTYMLLLEENNKILFSNMDLDEDKSDGLNTIESHMNLNGELEYDFNLVKSSENRSSGLKRPNPLEQDTITEYFNAWSQAAAEMDIEDDLNLDVINNFRKIVFSEASYEGVLKYNPDVRNFPMNVNISFTTDINKDFFNILKECHATEFFMGSQASSDQTKRQMSFVQSDGEFDSVGPTRVLNDFEEILKDAIGLGETLPETPLSIPGEEDYVYLGDLDNLRFSSRDQVAGSIVSKLLNLSLKSKVKDMIEKHHRGYDSILKGVPAYSETLFYEIEKYSSNSEGHLLDYKQSFFLPNDNESIVEFFDTQVKYNKYYVYRMFAHRVIIGTEYQLSLEAPYGGRQELFVDDPFEKSAGFSVITKPAVSLIKMPYYNVNESEVFFMMPGIIGHSPPNVVAPTHKTTIILDDPPLAPEVEIVPIKNQPNNIIINIKDTIGSVHETSRTLGEQDAAQHMDIFKNQYSNKYNVSRAEVESSYTEGSKIFFNSDEPSELLEIYKTKVKPINYSSFRNHLFRTFDGPNSSAIVSLDFNEKNYFTFRSVDLHGNYSNLSEIYEVELKENSGFVYPNIRVFNLEQETLKDEAELKEQISPFSETGKRFIMIKPSHHQVHPPEEPEGDSALEVVNFTLGDAEKSVFQKNRKFKIRIKSKKTGRAIDLNIQCKHLHDKMLIK